jgi:hypothetical protein
MRYASVPDGPGCYSEDCKKGGVMAEQMTPEKYRHKADQEYEMAGLARQDGDMADSNRRLLLAKEYMRLAREMEV